MSHNFFRLDAAKIAHNVYTAKIIHKNYSYGTLVIASMVESIVSEAPFSKTKLFLIVAP